MFSITENKSHVFQLKYASTQYDSTSYGSLGDAANTTRQGSSGSLKTQPSQIEATRSDSADLFSSSLIAQVPNVNKIQFKDNAETRRAALNDVYNRYLQNPNSSNLSSLEVNLNQARAFLKNLGNGNSEENQQYLDNLIRSVDTSIGLNKKRNGLLWSPLTLSNGKTCVTSFDGKNIVVTTDIIKLKSGGYRPKPNAKYYEFAKGTSAQSIKNSVILDQPRIKAQLKKPVDPQSDRDYTPPEKILQAEFPKDSFCGYAGIDVPNKNPKSNIVERYQVLIGIGKNGGGFYAVGNDGKKIPILDPKTGNSPATVLDAKNIARRMLKDNKITPFISDVSKIHKQIKKTAVPRTNAEKIISVLNDVTRNGSITVCIKGEMGDKKYSIGFSMNTSDIYNVLSGKINIGDFMKRSGFNVSVDFVVKRYEGKVYKYEDKRTISLRYDGTNYIREDGVLKRSFKWTKLDDLTFEAGGGAKSTSANNDVGAAVGPKFSWKISQTEKPIARFLTLIQKWVLRTSASVAIEAPWLAAGGLTLLGVIECIKATKPMWALEFGFPGVSLNLNYGTGAIRLAPVSLKPFVTSVSEIQKTSSDYFKQFIPESIFN